MPHADVNGQRLFYEDTGSGEPAIVWSHGLFMSHEMFAPQVAAFSGDHRCVAWDERGHGRTESAPEPFTYWDSASDVLGLMDHLGIERAILAGMSQGGFLSLRAALTAPDRVLALILLDTQAGPEDPVKLPGYEKMMEIWESGEPEAAEQVMQGVAAIVLGDYERKEDWVSRWRDMEHATLRNNFATLSAREDLHDRLAEIDVPALVVHARDDIAIEVGLAERLAAGLPQGELHVVETGGHAANLANPDAVNPHIERFLSRVTEGAPS